MKTKLHIEPIVIPEVSEEDIVKTIHISKQIVKKQAVKKREPNPYKVIKYLVFHHGRKEVFLQCGIGIMILLGLWLLLKVDNRNFVMAFFIVGSLSMSTCISSENIRSRIYQMWELEQACPYSPAKMVIWKSLLLSIISIVVITLGSFLLQNYFGYSMITLLIGGCIPFFLMNALVLHFQKYIESMNVLLIIYICSFVLFVVLGSNVSNILFSSKSIWMLLLVLGYFLYNLYKMKVAAHTL